MTRHRHMSHARAEVRPSIGREALTRRAARSVLRSAVAARAFGGGPACQLCPLKRPVGQPMPSTMMAI